MTVVIDFSRKLKGFKLFESFFYKLKDEGTLVFANNPLLVDDFGYDFNELQTNINNILYKHNAKSYTLCVIYDMNDQNTDPLRNSIVANMYQIKKNIVKPLSEDYPCDKVFYFSLDDIRRDRDGIPKSSNISCAIDFDSYGYICQDDKSAFSGILLHNNEISEIDNFWDGIKSVHTSKDGISFDDPKATVSEFQKKFDCIIKKKLDCVKKNFSDLLWYYEKLQKAAQQFLKQFEDVVYSNSNSINEIQSPSSILKNYLRIEVSSYHEYSSVILHIDVSDKSSAYNHDTLNFRHQLQIIALLIYLATNDTKMIFDSGNNILTRENHWSISIEINDHNLSSMLLSYNTKLKKELDNIGKFEISSIDFEEFSPRGISMPDNRKTKALSTLSALPKIKLFSSDSGVIKSFVDKRYVRYTQGVEDANKRLRVLTTKMRINKEADVTGQSKKGTVSEVSAIVEEMQGEISKLENEIALYCPNEGVKLDTDLRRKYDVEANEITRLMKKQIKLSSFIKNIFIIIAVSLCCYPVLQLANVPNRTMAVLSILAMVIPACAYVTAQLIYAQICKKKIIDRIVTFASRNETLINSLYNGNEMTYIQNSYDLIMRRKYVNKCMEKIEKSNRKSDEFKYHKEKLSEHKGLSDRLLDILQINFSEANITEIEKIDSVQRNKSVEKNAVYCPLNYLTLIEPIKTKAVVNDQQNVEVENGLTGFIDKFVIAYDKEYQHD